MKLIIAGTRSFDNERLLNEKLEKFRNEVTEVVSGNARGADQMGELWAAANGIDVKLFPADWMRHGRIAGFIRNEQMAKYADSLVVFWDGKSPGTFNMIATMRKEGKPIRIIYYETADRGDVQFV